MVPSTFAWLDYSARERRTMLEIVDLFREKGTVDELGVGTIRDAFADNLFPGTSTLHSRARYNLFIPWVYRRLERERVPGAKIADRARALQLTLVEALVAGGEREGVIGIDAREKLLRLPSVVYWGALGRLSLRLYPGSVEQYHASIDAWYEPGRRARRGEDNELIETAHPNWHQGLPEPPETLWERTTFALTPDEATYLQERILTAAPESLFAYCLREPRDLRAIERPWTIPHLADAPPTLRSLVEEARRFALLMVGAVLVYNLMLAEASCDAGLRDGTLVERYRRDLAAWADGRIRPELDGLRAWHRSGTLWDCLARIALSSSWPARRFANEWITDALANPWGVGDEVLTRRRIEQRERALKGGLARLASRRALERWNGESGLGELVYRWPNARVVIDDVAGALSAGGSDA